jgi:hypothetical protein
VDTGSLATYLVGAAIVGMITAIIRLWGKHMAHTRHVAETYVSHEALSERLQPLITEQQAVKALAQEILQTVSELKGKYQGQQDARRS